MAKNDPTIRIQVMADGPYLVQGALPLQEFTIITDEQGESVQWQLSQTYPAQANYALCRCGQSNTKPFCDGSHKVVGFKGTEQANRSPYLEQAILYEGPVLSLTDVESLCAYARFCDTNGQVWRLVEQTDDPQKRQQFIESVSNCPAGRLMAWHNASQNRYEPELPNSIGLVEDPAIGCSGPIWVRGQIPIISSDGYYYECLNRTALCRCGQSSNKPFCDGTHASIRFQAKGKI